METLRLWHQRYRSSDSVFSFHATAVQTQGLNHGTDAMIVKMLEDLAVDAQATGWTLRRVATSYLSDDRRSPDWRDIWLVTGLVDVRVTKPLKPIQHGRGFGHTTAWDDTWTPRTRPPDRCLIVADFASAEDARQVVKLFDVMSSTPGPDLRAAAIGQAFPSVGDTTLRRLVAASKRGVPGAERCGDPLQVHISVDADPTHFKDATARAERVEAFLHAAGATTNWRDRGA